MRCSHNAKIWLANARALTTRCQRTVTYYDGWRFTGLLISISEIDSLTSDYRSFANASRRRRCPRDSANSLRKELDISSVLFGKAFLKPKCKNLVLWPDQPDDIFPLLLIWRQILRRNPTYKIAVKILMLHLQTRQKSLHNCSIVSLPFAAFLGVSRLLEDGILYGMFWAIILLDIDRRQWQYVKIRNSIGYG